MAEPFTPWAYLEAKTAIEAATTLDELEAVVARCSGLVQDQGALMVSDAIARRRFELRLGAGAPTTPADFRRAVDAARDEERRLLLAELERIAVRRDELAREYSRSRASIKAGSELLLAKEIRVAARRLRGARRS